MPYLFLVLLATLLVTASAHAEAFATPKKLVGFYESEANVGPDDLPLTPRPGSTTDSPVYKIRQVGPIDFQAGDCVDIRARKQFTNNNQANGWWTVGRIKSEHWYLLVGVRLTIRATIGVPNLETNPGSPLRPWTGEQWDALIHHWHWDASEKHCTNVALSDVYFYTPVYFISSNVWRQSDAQFIDNDQRGKLEVLHFGSR